MKKPKLHREAKHQLLRLTPPVTLGTRHVSEKPLDDSTSQLYDSSQLRPRPCGAEKRLVQQVLPNGRLAGKTNDWFGTKQEIIRILGGFGQVLGHRDFQ